MKICTLFNGRSGGAQAIGPQVKQLAERDAACWIPIDQLPSDQGLVDIVQAEKPDRVILVGGDGTVSRSLATLDSPSDLQFGIVPTGTGNDLARSLDIPLGDVEAAWNLAIDGEAKPMDLVQTSVDEPKLLMNAVTAGIGGVVAEEIQSETKQTYGALAYWMSALSVLSDPPVFRVQLKLDEQEIIEKEVYAFCVANGRCAGGGFVIAPEAKLDDGKIHVTLLPAISTIEMFESGLNFVLTNEDAERRIVTYNAKEVAFESSPEIPCSLDGEKATFDSMKFKILPAARWVVGGPNAAFST
ncbi:diacylglycerol/lipid kinase family protein [Bremerella sp. T1]|uniref:diacylglycerol/lipid kinase family protein n=1 Tax=Bremerella sp. TYQ1 TaxID=3119568 RepID=UPI001CCB2724|nr:diacylglycerol kinase family protein [Bremerella volcania]UBM34517.1 diacylglycerol kinase family lipid kinase [Bremerella volcania]